MNDRTSAAAIGAAYQEWRNMARLALKIRNGRYSSSWCDEQEKKFKGIYKRLLTDPIRDVERAAR